MNKVILQPQEVTEAMVEHVRRFLLLENRKGPNKYGKYNITFEGDTDKGIHCVVEVITKTDKAADAGNYRRRIHKRSSPQKRKERTHTVMIFPKARDYAGANPSVETPYCRATKLLETVKYDQQDSITLQRWKRDMRDRHDKFAKNYYKNLSRVEFEVALLLGDGRIHYFEIDKDGRSKIVVHRFHNIPYDTILPASRPINQNYFWDFVESGQYPYENQGSNARTFRDIQEGLHDEVKMIAKTDRTHGSFELVPSSATVNERVGRKTNRVRYSRALLLPRTEVQLQLFEPTPVPQTL